MIAVNLVGVYAIGPEEFLCALLEWEEEQRYVPVWLSLADGAALAAAIEGQGRRRPTVHDAMTELITRATTGINTIAVTSYYQGVFISELSLRDGTTIDMRTSDALLLAVASDTQILVDESVLQHASMHLNPATARELFDLDLEDELDQSEIEGEFEEFMRELGLDGGDGGNKGDKPSSSS